MSAAAMTSVLSELTAIFADDDAAKAHALAVHKRKKHPPWERYVRTPFVGLWDISERRDGTTANIRRYGPGHGLTYYRANTLSTVVPRATESKEQIAAFARACGVTVRKSWTRKQMIQAILKA
jgi:hypothetical protein